MRALTGKASKPLLRRLLIAIPLLLGIVGGAAVLFYFNPTEYSFYPRCPLVSFTGLLCPGCGTTRALYELVHLRLKEAFYLNPLMVLFLPLMPLMLVRKGVVHRVLAMRWTPIGLFILFLVYGVLRNIDGLPEGFLVR